MAITAISESGVYTSSLNRKVYTKKKKKIHKEYSIKDVYFF